MDAAQGIQAQTVANFYLAFGEGLHIIPVINKVFSFTFPMFLYSSTFLKNLYIFHLII